MNSAEDEMAGRNVIHQSKYLQDIGRLWYSEHRSGHRNLHKLVLL